MSDTVQPLDPGVLAQRYEAARAATMPPEAEEATRKLNAALERSADEGDSCPSATKFVHGGAYETVARSYFEQKRYFVSCFHTSDGNTALMVTQSTCTPSTPIIDDPKSCGIQLQKQK